MTPLHTYPSISKLTYLSRYNLGSESTVAKEGKIPALPEFGVHVYNLGGLTLNYQSLLFTHFLSSLGLGMGQYLAEVPRGASAVLQTQAHIVLCFAVAAVCGSLEVREGFCVVPCLHVLCPCRKRSTNTFPTVTFHILDQVAHLFPESPFPSRAGYSCAALTSPAGSLVPETWGWGLEAGARDGWLCLLIWPIALVALREQLLPWAVNHMPELFPTNATLSGV